MIEGPFTVKAAVLDQLDKSDPLNELVCVGLKVYRGDQLVGNAVGRAREDRGVTRRAHTEVLCDAIAAAVTELLSRPLEPFDGAPAGG